MEAGPYELKGLSATCLGVFVSSLGKGTTPMVFFLMEDGSLEYLDVERALLSAKGEIDHFISEGKLPGPKNIVRFALINPHADPDKDGIYAQSNRVLYAYDQNEERYDLYQLYHDEEKRRLEK